MKKGKMQKEAHGVMIVQEYRGGTLILKKVSMQEKELDGRKEDAMEKGGRWSFTRYIGGRKVYW